MFGLYDINGDGVIDMDEIIEIMRSTNNNNQARFDMLKIFKRFDKNHDGVLSYEEFYGESMTNPVFLNIIGLGADKHAIQI